MAGQGPSGKHGNLDSYTTSTPPTPPNTITGYLVPAVKNINQSDPKNGPKKGSKGQINRDTFCE
jgi:hypothetical protein